MKISHRKGLSPTQAALPTLPPRRAYSKFPVEADQSLVTCLSEGARLPLFSSDEPDVDVHAYPRPALAIRYAYSTFRGGGSVR